MPGGRGDMSLGDCSSVLLVCRDCGRTAVWFDREFARIGCGPSTSLSTFSRRLKCTTCSLNGNPGKSFTVKAFPARVTQEAA